MIGNRVKDSCGVYRRIICENLKQGCLMKFYECAFENVI